MPRGAKSRKDAGQDGHGAPAPAEGPYRAHKGQREVHARSTAGHQNQLGSSSNQVTVRPPRRRQPHRRQACHHLKPPAAFRIPASRAQLRCPRPAPIGHLHTDKTVPRADRDRDCPARSARPAMPDTIAEQLAHQQGSVIPARMPRTEHPAHERAGDPRPLRPPGQRHALPDHRPGHQRTRPSPPTPPRGSHRAAGRTHGDARSTHRRASSRNTLSARPVRGCPWKADGAHRPS
jgi:hypothetical protein